MHRTFSVRQASAAPLQAAPSEKKRKKEKLQAAARYSRATTTFVALLPSESWWPIGSIFFVATRLPSRRRTAATVSWPNRPAAPPSSTSRLETNRTGSPARQESSLWFGGAARLRWHSSLPVVPPAIAWPSPLPTHEERTGTAAAWELTWTDKRRTPN